MIFTFCSFFQYRFTMAFTIARWFHDRLTVDEVPEIDPASSEGQSERGRIAVIDESECI